MPHRVRGDATEDLRRVFDTAMKALNLPPSAVQTARAALWTAILDAHESGVAQSFSDLADLTGMSDIRKRAEEAAECLRAEREKKAS